MIFVFLAILNKATYFPTPTMEWPSYEPEPEWPTKSPVWKSPYDPTPDIPSESGLTKGQITTIAVCSSLALVIVCVVAGVLIHRHIKNKIVESELCPDPLL